MDYTKLLLQIRAKFNISQQELADRMNVSFTTINRWENGKTMPTKKHLCIIENICKEHNIDFKDLVENE